jgi:hypothetical protein
MDRPLLADEREQFGGKPGRHEAPVGAVGIVARVEQPCDAPRHEAVGIEEILFQPQPRKGAFQVPDRIVGHAVAQDVVGDAVPQDVVGDAVPQDEILRAPGSGSGRPGRSRGCRRRGRGWLAGAVTVRARGRADRGR